MATPGRFPAAGPRLSGSSAPNRRRAQGIAVNGNGFRGLDRKADHSISEDEAANILAFFDKDKDGLVRRLARRSGSNGPA